MELINRRQAMTMVGGGLVAGQVACLGAVVYPNANIIGSEQSPKSEDTIEQKLQIMHEMFREMGFMYEGELVEGYRTYHKLTEDYVTILAGDPEMVCRSNRPVTVRKVKRVNCRTLDIEDMPTICLEKSFGFSAIEAAQNLGV